MPEPKLVILDTEDYTARSRTVRDNEPRHKVAASYDEGARLSVMGLFGPASTNARLFRGTQSTEAVYLIVGNGDKVKGMRAFTIAPNPKRPGQIDVIDVEATVADEATHRVPFVMGMEEDFRVGAGDKLQSALFTNGRSLDVIAVLETKARRWSDLEVWNAQLDKAPVLGLLVANTERTLNAWPDLALGQLPAR